MRRVFLSLSYLRIRIKECKMHAVSRMRGVDSLLIPLVTEKTAVLGGVVGRQGRNTSRRMAFVAEFFRRFLVHRKEPGMVVIFGQMLGRLFGCVPEKEEEAAADHDKYEVVEQYIFAFGIILFGIHCVFQVSRPSRAC